MAIVSKDIQAQESRGYDYTVDDVSDIATLPVMPENAGGSTAFVINTSSVYMLGSQGWKQL